MLRALRKTVLNNREDEEELNKFLDKKSRKYYIERNYKNIKIYKYFLFLRKKGADLNRWFDIEIESEKKNKK
ncbi:hypothetical protein D1003_10820 [Riemerella anatipestifer]|nr:hypothetical protein [Riemerella anatipestifer]